MDAVVGLIKLQDHEYSMTFKTLAQGNSKITAVQAYKGLQMHNITYRQEDAAKVLSLVNGGSDRLTFHQFRQYMYTIQNCPVFDPIVARFYATDDHMEGRIDYLRVHRIVQQMWHQLQHENLHEMFDAVDTANNSFITVNQFQEVMRRIEEHFKVAPPAVEAVQAKKPQKPTEKTLQVIKPDVKAANAAFDQVQRNGRVLLPQALDAICKFGGQQISFEQASRLIKLIDKNGDGHVDREEFVHLYYVIINKASDSIEKTYFLLADKDFSGTVDVQELVSVLDMVDIVITPAQAADYIKMVAGNASSVKYEEFVKIMEMVIDEDEKGM